MSSLKETCSSVEALLIAALFLSDHQSGLSGGENPSKGWVKGSAFTLPVLPKFSATLFLKGTAKRDYRWDDLMEATNNLSDQFIIGSGGTGISKWRKNGSLWEWLHQQPVNGKKRQSLDRGARLEIGVELAQGVEYLQHDCVPKIMHRHINSSHVLLDSNMEAHLGDFGLAKALEESYDSNTESLSWCGALTVILLQSMHTRSRQQKPPHKRGPRRDMHVINYYIYSRIEWWILTTKNIDPRA
ncbi:hypothetical protein DKX38_000529 [Salix brachista]|uniref:Protein kinase domain-containing protein n=1 Tax=Salix brachista TaxID=2182728 RepID=A0A5N5P113_9ROSI|nr:hypothetical protein DKX38_000529 [Salix brachista]